MMFRSSQFIAFAMAAISISTGLSAQEKADDATPPLVIRFYDISLLNAPPQHNPFDDGELDNPLVLQSNTVGYGGGGAGGGGGFGGGSGAGGGYFSLPMEPAQFGGGSGGSGAQTGNGNGGLGGGGLGGMSVQSVPASISGLKQQLADQGHTLADLLVIHVATESWEDSGTGSGSIMELGNTLIIRQTEHVHQQVAEFLRSLSTTAIGTGTFQVEAWWLPAMDGEGSEVKSLLSGKLEEAVVLERLSAIAENEGGCHGTLLCRDRVTTHTASGKRVPVIAGSTPVVGTGSSGYSPQVRTLHLGLMLEARVTSVPDFLTSPTDAKKLETVELNFKTRITEPDAQIQERATFEKVDRYVLAEHSAAGCCRIRVGTPTLIGSLTQVSKREEHASEAPPELQLVVCITRTEE